MSDVASAEHSNKTSQMCCVMMHAPHAYSKLQVNNKLAPHKSALCSQKEISNCMDGAEEPINSQTRNL